MLKRRILNYGLAGLLLAVPAILLHANLKQPEALNSFDQAVLRVSSPLQALVSWSIEGLGGLWNRYVWLVDVDEENRELRAENQRLRNELAVAVRRASDVEVLEQLVGLRRETPADTIGARVVAASINSFFRVSRIRLDRGQDEIATGMSVISESGLVGRIGRVYGDYADVLLAVDPQSSISVEIARTGSRGSLRGTARDDSYVCEIEMLERDDKPVEVGDLVVTSDLGDVPGGIPVGQVVKVNTKDYGMFQEVEVAPAVDFSTLRTVLILLARPPKPDPDAGKRDRSEPAFGARPY
ncbi:MAG: rod shape-determining protein MreC [Myxococcota bacterium]